MSMDLLSNNSTREEFHEDSIFPRIVRFWILVIFSLPSMICSLFVLWLLLSNPEYRRSLNHRVIIIQLIGVLIFLLINVPLYLNYLRLGSIWPQIPVVCQLEWFVGDRYIDTMTTMIVWTLVERHMCTFHDRWILTARKRFFAHFLPVSSVIIYGPFYYFFVEDFPSCENITDTTESPCSVSCFYRNKILVVYEVVFNDIPAIILIAVFSISLIIRVVYRRSNDIHRPVQWRQHRRILILSLSISAIYLLLNLPMMIFNLVQLCGLFDNIIERLYSYLDFFNYFIFLLSPFICLGAMSKKIGIRHPRRLVAPTVFAISMRPIVPRQD